MDASELVLTECQTDAPVETVAAERLSFDQAFIVHHRAVYRFAYALTRDSALAEDVTQEVFIRLHRNLETSQRDGLLRAWLLRVTANFSRNVLRRRRRTRLREALIGSQRTFNHTAGPEEVLVRREEITEARRALDKIKEPMRSCLLLKHEGMSYREIAITLGIKEASVGSLISRGRREFIRVYRKIGKP
jgi:RNA polymerase sigma-70 factor (ECF subfamily)